MSSRRACWLLRKVQEETDIAVTARAVGKFTKVVVNEVPIQNCNYV